MRVLGIDPSFTGTGLVLMEDGVLLKSSRVAAPHKVYEGIDLIHKNCNFIIKQIQQFINDEEIDQVIIEYPVLSSISGAYLAILNGFLAVYFKHFKVCWVPPMAVDSLTKNSYHNKTHLVKYCRERGYISKRTSHDICTAIILCELLQKINEGTYKNKYFWN